MDAVYPCNKCAIRKFLALRGVSLSAQQACLKAKHIDQCVDMIRSIFLKKNMK